MEKGRRRGKTGLDSNPLGAASDYIVEDFKVVRVLSNPPVTRRHAKGGTTHSLYLREGWNSACPPIPHDRVGWLGGDNQDSKCVVGLGLVTVVSLKQSARVWNWIRMNCGDELSR